MIDILAGELGRNVTTAVVVSGVLALLIVAGVGVAWWRAGRWVNAGRRSMRTLGAEHRFLAAGEEPDGPSGTRPEGPDARSAAGGAGGQRGPTEQERASRWLSEAAARAGAFRNTWERSYREARASSGEPRVNDAPSAELAVLMGELLGEQRETNRLLRELAERLDRASR